MRKRAHHKEALSKMGENHKQQNMRLVMQWWECTRVLIVQEQDNPPLERFLIFPHVSGVDCERSRLSVSSNSVRMRLLVVVFLVDPICGFRDADPVMLS